jgi:phosphoribosylanthranilate isomerase
MTNGVRVKVCGITSPGDAAAALACGADFLGFIQHPPSPRYVAPARLAGLLAGLGSVPKVGVAVAGSLERPQAMVDAGFDFFQLHVPNDMPLEALQRLIAAFPKGSVWLAPRVPPGDGLNPAYLALADTFLMDTFHPGQVGGTGRTGDWPGFLRHRTLHPGKTWILAGGLAPETIASALRETRAQVVDVNSGVESTPGVKDPSRLRSFFEALRAFRWD